MSNFDIENGEYGNIPQTKFEYSQAILDVINFRLLDELDELILSPENGIQRIRKVLYQFSLDMPALYEAPIEGDEVVFDISEFTSEEDEEHGLFLYIIYSLTDDGNYDFHSEVLDSDGLDSLLYSDEMDDTDDEYELDDTDDYSDSEDDIRKSH